jgi:hypothetical protein
VPIPSMASGQVVLFENLGAESDASFADEEPGTGDKSREVSRFRRLGPYRPAEIVAEGTSRGIRELATLGHGEEHRQIHAASVPQPCPVAGTTRRCRSRS